MTQSHVDTHVVTPCSYALKLRLSYALVTRVGYALVTHVITHWLRIGYAYGYAYGYLPCLPCRCNQGVDRHPLN